MPRHAEVDGRGCCPACSMVGQVTHTQDARQPGHPWYREIDQNGAGQLAGVLCRDCYLATVRDEERRIPSPAALRDWRRAERLTQEQAAALAGVERLAWARWETEARSVPQWLADVLRQRWGSAPTTQTTGR